jgi:hypothetical protein
VNLGGHTLDGPVGVVQLLVPAGLGEAAECSGQEGGIVTDKARPQEDVT